MKNEVKKIDTKEFDLPETVFSRNIDNRVFQGIILQCLASIEGIALVGGSFIDNFLGRTSPEGIKGIHAEQDSKNQGIDIKIEVNICYGYVIPDKAEEIQTRVAEEITRLTGLHVASIHIAFKNVIPCEEMNRTAGTAPGAQAETEELIEDFSDEF
jgi:uncharacterized alkaline shock family protein YloU